MAQNATSQTFENPNTAPFRPQFQPSDFAAGWSAGAGWSGEISPSLVSFGATPTVAQNPGPSGSSDYGGVREAHMYVETINGVETWFLFYGAGDGTNTTSGEWRPQLATSTNRGVSWTKLGPLNIGLQSGDGNAPYSRDMLYMEKRGSAYYLHAMKGMSVSAVTSRGRVPAAPYLSDTWTMPDAGAGPVGNWTYVRDDLALTSAGQPDSECAYMNSMIGSGAQLFMFYNSASTDGSGNFSAATASDPAGPWTTTGDYFFSPAIPSGTIIENPKIFFHPFLGTYVCSFNESMNSEGITKRNIFFVSANLLAWDVSSRKVYMNLSAMDGEGAVGLMTPFWAVEGIPQITSDGYMPLCYDANPISSTGVDTHVGRQILYSVLEPSRTRLKYAASVSQVFSDSFTGTAGTQINGINGWVQLDGNGGNAVYLSGGGLSLGTSVGETIVYNTNTSALVDATVTAPLTLDAACTIGILFRQQSDNTHYKLEITPGGTGDTIAPDPTHYYAVLNRTETQVAPASGSVLADLGAFALSKVVTATMSGNVCTVQLGSNTAVTLTDPGGNYITAAGPIGFRNGGGGTGARTVGSVTVDTATASFVASGTYTSRANTDGIAEFAVDMLDAPATGGFIAFDFRTQSNGDTYRLKCATGGGLSLYKEVGGVETAIGASYGSQVTAQSDPCRIRVKFSGTSIQAWLNGEQQINVTDSTFASGVKLGFFAQSNTFGVRNLALYPSDTVTINGLVSGQVVTLRAPGGPPIESKTASGNAVTFTEAHYPAGSVDIDGVDHLVQGGIWGGDTHAFAPGQRYSFA